jgi:hypothetical protein
MSLSQYIEACALDKMEFDREEVFGNAWTRWNMVK